MESSIEDLNYELLILEVLQSVTIVLNFPILITLLLTSLTDQKLTVAVV